MEYEHILPVAAIAMGSREHTSLRRPDLDRDGNTHGSSDWLLFWPFTPSIDCIQISYLLAVYVDIELCPHTMERSGEPISAVAAHGRPVKYYSGERYREAAPQQRLAGDAATATLMEAISYCS